MSMNDNELKARGMHLWANYIETGNVILSAVDLKNQGNEKALKVLQPEQRDLVSRLRLLAEQELKAGSRMMLDDLPAKRPHR